MGQLRGRAWSVAALLLWHVAKLSTAAGAASQAMAAVFSPLCAAFVALQFTINDGNEKGDAPFRRSHERLLRKLLNYKNRPAVVEMVFWPHPHGETAMKT
jgi:hypothetical protein